MKIKDLFLAFDSNNYEIFALERSLKRIKIPIILRNTDIPTDCLYARSKIFFINIKLFFFFKIFIISKTDRSVVGFHIFFSFRFKKCMIALTLLLLLYSTHILYVCCVICVTFFFVLNKTTTFQHKIMINYLFICYSFYFRLKNFKLLF